MYYKTLGSSCRLVRVPEPAWIRIDYPDGGEAQVGETDYGEERLVVRRTRLTGHQAQLFPDWR